MHGGPGSGRYPLGSGERPYQHQSGYYFPNLRERDEARARVNEINDLLINGKYSQQSIEIKALKNGWEEWHPKYLKDFETADDIAIEGYRLQKQLASDDMQDYKSQKRKTINPRKRRELQKKYDEAEKEYRIAEYMEKDIVDLWKREDHRPTTKRLQKTISKYK